MSLLKGTIPLLVLTVLLGCKSTYSEKTLTDNPPPVLNNSTRIYVAVPYDATFKKKVAQGSGRQTTDALRAAFIRYTRPVYSSRMPESIGEALESARKANANYLVYPSITQWEDRATEFTGRRDKMSIKVDLIDLETSQVAFSREIAATGKWMSDGGDQPKDLLDQPAQEFVNALFRRVEKPSALW